MTLPFSFLPLEGLDTVIPGRGLVGVGCLLSGNSETSVETAPRALWVVLPLLSGAPSICLLAVLERAHTLLILRATLPAGGKLVCDSCVTPSEAPPGLGSAPH